jgi:hypothetical protein
MPPKARAAPEKSESEDEPTLQDLRNDIAKDAAKAAAQALRTLRDVQLLHPVTKKKIPQADITLAMVDIKEIAERYEERLLACGSSVHALEIQLGRWRQSGKDAADIICKRGRPSTTVMSPVASESLRRLVDSNKQGHHGFAAGVAVIANMLRRSGGGFSRGMPSQRQQKKVLKELRKAHGVVTAVSTATEAKLLYASTDPHILNKFHETIQAAYEVAWNGCKSIFEAEPNRICNNDEADKNSRMASKSSRKQFAFTTVNRIVASNREQLRHLDMDSGYDGGASANPWLLASGKILAKTPIGKAPPGHDPGPNFTAPPAWTTPATHDGQPFLPGMSRDYFTHGNTRVYCTATGSNNKECMTRMFIDFVYPKWRQLVPEGPLLWAFDSCRAHGWTEELARFCGEHDVHILKLFHNTTTKTQPADCGFNMAWRQVLHELTDNFIAAASFKNGYLTTSMVCAFRDPPSQRRL